MIVTDLREFLLYPTAGQSPFEFPEKAAEVVDQAFPLIGASCIVR